MKLNYNKFIIPFFLLLILSLTGCREELIVEEFNVDSEHYYETGRLLGNSKVDFDIKLSQEADLNYHWTANGGNFLSQTDNQATYRVPTAPGDYRITVFIQDDQGNETTYNFSFAVEGDYPEQVLLNEVKNDSVVEGVKLNWSTYLEDDFFTYQILRSNNFYIDNNAEVIAEIDDQVETYYLDQDVAPNQIYTYQVMVINEQGYLSVSNEELIEILDKGIREVALGKRVSDLVFDELRSQLYLLDQQENQLLIFDTQEDEITEEIEVGPNPKHLKLSKDNTYLFLVTEGNNSLVQVDLEQLKVSNYNFKQEIKDITLGTDYLYLKVDDEANLLQFNIREARVEDSYQLKNGRAVVTGEKIELVGEEQLLIDAYFTETFIYDLSEISNPIRKLRTGIIDDLEIHNDAEEKDIYIASSQFDYVQSFVLNQAGEVELVRKFKTAGYPRGIAVAQEAGWLFIAYNDTEVSLFSLDTHSLLDKIDLRDYAYDLVFDSNQNKLYILTSSINQREYRLVIVDLMEAVDF
ncbi:hypothetical protein MWH25_07455 [Natroniella acetigena]|uniref:YncE family protein n=1 Tax=Natroniella acetigena TaxID=52004 RepID=UPI00200AB34C|nr:hypothetical protein [Natroniella acetigena]MCK8827577.1 hypothetical protein [Natroniella acetigena]